MEVHCLNIESLQLCYFCKELIPSILLSKDRVHCREFFVLGPFHHCNTHFLNIKIFFKNVYTSPYLKRYLPLVSLKHLPSGEQQTSVLLGFLVTVKELLPQVQFLPSFKHTSPHKSTSLGPSQACLTSLDEQLSPIKVVRRKRTDDTRKLFISKLGISPWTINLISCSCSCFLFS